MSRRQVAVEPLASPQHFYCPRDSRQLRLRDGRTGQRAVGERREAAVRCQQDTLLAEHFDGATGPRGDFFDGLDSIELLVDDAHADAAVGGQLAQHLDLTRARRAELEKERADVDLLEDGQERSVVSREGGALVAGPVAAADVEPEPLARKALDDTVDELGGKSQLMPSIALLAQRPAHEAPRVLGAGEDHFGEDGLVEL